VNGGGAGGAVGIGTAIAEEMDERELDAGLTGDASADDEAESFVEGGGVGVEEEAGDLDDVAGEMAAADWVLGNEFEERGIAEIVFSFESDATMDEIGMLLKMSAESGGITGVEEIDGVAEDGIGDALVMRKIEAVGGSGFFGAGFETRPTRETGLAGDDELSVRKLDRGGKDFGVGGVGETRMEFAEKLRDGGNALRVIVEKIFGLMLEVREIGIGR